MVKLLIVEDEKRIRDGIKNSIDWASNGISICGEAENGAEALDLIVRLSPDIMLLDIRMPVMSGLQVLEALKAGDFPVKSIILSGYDDFSYVQKALRFGASDYLLKPCPPDEMLNTVLNVKGLIENETGKKEMLARLKLQINESLPFLKEKYLLKLVRGEAVNPQTVNNNFDLYRIAISPAGLTVIALDIDEYFIFSEQNSNETLELYRFAVKNIASEVLSAGFASEILDDNEKILILVNTDTQECQRALKKKLGDIKTNVKDFLDLTVSFGIGNRYESILHTHKSYVEALKAVEMKIFSGKDNIIEYSEMQTYEAEGRTYPIEEEREILASIKSCRPDELESRLDEFFTVLNPQDRKKEFVLQAGLALTLSIYHLCIEKNIDNGTIADACLSTLQKIHRLDSLELLKSTLLQLVRSVTEKLNSKKTGNKTIELALKYIEENFARDLSLEIVAREVYISPSYLSLLFKQTQGINFIEYIHKLRIEKACELLRDPRVKVGEVAKKVGYSEERYFYQIFKRITGMTPTQFKLA